jgi:hypothetical protein
MPLLDRDGLRVRVKVKVKVGALDGQNDGNFVDTVAVKKDRH